MSPRRLAGASLANKALGAAIPDLIGLWRGLLVGSLQRVGFLRTIASLGQSLGEAPLRHRQVLADHLGRRGAAGPFDKLLRFNEIVHLTSSVLLLASIWGRAGRIGTLERPARRAPFRNPKAVDKQGK